MVPLKNIENRQQFTLAGGKEYKQTDRQTNKQTNKQTDRQTNRQKNFFQNQIFVDSVGYI